MNQVLKLPVLHDPDANATYLVIEAQGRVLVIPMTLSYDHHDQEWSVTGFGRPTLPPEFLVPLGTLPFQPQSDAVPNLGVVRRKVQAERDAERRAEIIERHGLTPDELQVLGVKEQG